MNTNNQLANSFSLPTFLAGANRRTILTHKAVEDGLDAVDIILNSLARWSSVNDDQFNEKRSFQRLSYQGQPIIVVWDDISSEKSKEEIICFESWGRNVSANGASLLCHKVITPIDESETFVELYRIIKTLSCLVIGLELKNDNWVWFSGEVRHMRSLQSGLLELGVKLVDRISPSPHS